MSISSVGGAPPAKIPEALEPKGPELKNDHDADDGAAKPRTATPPPGQGVNLDTKA